METGDFARRFDCLFRATYRLAVRRIRDRRDRLTPETVALLQHLAQAGPATIGELTRHFDRAASTLSEMIEPLVTAGLIERDRDPADGRRHLLWLSGPGMARLAEAERVLDLRRLDAAAAGFTPSERVDLIRLLDRMTELLRADPPPPPEADPDPRATPDIDRG